MGDLFTARLQGSDLALLSHDMSRDVGFASITLLSLLVGYGTHFVTTLVAITYPCYQTVALIGKSRNDKQDVQWSTYWVIYAVFTLLECASDAIVKFFPFFYLTKVVMLAWCMAPIEANGSNVLHQNVLKRFAGSSKSD
ncbi:hypothetical protein BSL78_27880 [Apostichopus japonicus]|uniref:Receptor expression-enhancing protein n=1 Tax=Stichopus japonicus TaxID=307972 RepID=A0A2G8JHS2_STIJA|nr:hypothetical protein BSL78_27880 [Apostichopus japonicus]